MRAGGCTVQQALTAEAAIVVKQSLNLARRRGHAQVTPLHVASTLLSSGGLLREACQQTHSHPLQCKALELCFNVALNRLPTSSSILTAPTSYRHRQNFPTLSNALIAAFKRAQAHQRRGLIDTQQQPLLAVKIELEQLVISILDDPSVSRVMREANFSSTQVKSHVEKSVSVEITFAPNTNHKNAGNKRKEATTVQGNKVMDQVRSEDVVRVLDCFSSGIKRCVVVVGECESTTQSVIRVVMDKIARGSEVSEGLRNTQLLPLSFSSFRFMTREEVDNNVSELKTLVKSCWLRRRSVLIILEDFKWVCDEWEKICMEKRRESNNNGHSPFEHVMMEVRSLINGDIWSERVWMLGFCTSQCFMRCRAGQPSLETLWGLHSVPISDGGQLGLSLNCESEMAQNQTKGKGNTGNGSCCSCTEAGGETHINGCQNHAASNLTLSVSSSSPSSSRSHSTSMCANPSFHHLHHQSWRDHHLWLSEANEVPLDLSNPTTQTNPNLSSSSSDGKTNGLYRPKFKELNADNLKNLCNALEKNVPWQKGIIPEIASTVLRCRSGMMRRKERSRLSCGVRHDTWFSFRGTDSRGKEKIARELANLIFGSHNHFISIEFNSFSSSAYRFNTTDDATKKRSRLKNDHGYFEQLFEALRDDLHRVIFLKDVDRLDYDCRIGILRAINNGRVRSSDGEDQVGLDDAIIVLSAEEKDADSGFGLDLNVCAQDSKDDDDDVSLLEAVDSVVLFEMKENL